MTGNQAGAESMTEASAAHVPVYTRRSQGLASIIGRWMLLVPGCAIPIVLAARHSLSAPELMGAGVGIATWTAVMVRLHLWRLVAGHDGETTRLTAGAVILMAGEWILLATAPSLALLAVYSPSAMVMAASAPAALRDVEPLMAYLLTLACGAQALACVAALAWGMARVNDARTRAAR
jgi:hypothetical protein